ASSNSFGPKGGRCVPATVAFWKQHVAQCQCSPRMARARQPARRNGNLDAPPPEGSDVDDCAAWNQKTRGIGRRGTVDTTLTRCASEGSTLALPKPLERRERHGR